jgi:hypothetical protein
VVGRDSEIDPFGLVSLRGHWRYTMYVLREASGAYGRINGTVVVWSYADCSSDERFVHLCQR